mmetsp:Transcript_654/g.906  ORF Transcript_654/g.906 Transcript_654/m.906 type:complete len:571 (+) Transcript_654:87-1799(+)
MSSHHTYNDDDHAALQEVETILGETRPKHIGDGILKGIGSIYHGCIGSVGMLVLSPFEGAKGKSGCTKKVTGFVTGAGVGVVRSVDVGAGGIVQGVGQVVRGVLQTPEAIVSPHKGKWWNDNDGKWVYTDLKEERKWLLAQPTYNEDILGEHVVVEEDDDQEDQDAKKQVADMHYYNALELSASATEDQIERQYHKLARRYSPGRAGAGPKAAKAMEEIGTAYMILTNPEFREGYDRYGMGFIHYGGLSGTFDPAQHTDIFRNEEPLIDPFVLYSVLFGSEQLHDWIGTLGAATAAAKQTPLTKTEARVIQFRRVTKLALSLAERLQEYCDCDDDDDNKDLAAQKWKMEGENLVQTSYGNELVKTIGQVYCLCSVQFTGSLENGSGALPSMSAWAKRQYANLRKGIHEVAHDVTHPAGDWNELKVLNAIQKHKDEDLAVAQELLKREGVKDTYMRYLWTRTVLDITNTLHETAQMVLFDQSVSPQVRLARAEGLHRLGEILVEESIRHARSDELSSLGLVESSNMPVTTTYSEATTEEDRRVLYEEVAFAAMLETCVRKEQESRHAHSNT